jgi:hypothetical protein
MYLQFIWPDGRIYEEVCLDGTLRDAKTMAVKRLNEPTCEVNTATIIGADGEGELWTLTRDKGRRAMLLNLVDAENYFEYAEALHAWLSLNHNGQHSVEYVLLSSSQFKPGFMWSESRVKHENSVYGEITYENCVELMTEVSFFTERARDK